MWQLGLIWAMVVWGGVRHRCCHLLLQRISPLQWLRLARPVSCWRTVHRWRWAWFWTFFPDTSLLRCVELRVLVVFLVFGIWITWITCGFCYWLFMVLLIWWLHVLLSLLIRKWTIWFIDFLRLDFYDACVTIYIYMYIKSFVYMLWWC